MNSKDFFVYLYMEIFNFTNHLKEDLLKTGVYKIYHELFPDKVYIGSASRIKAKSSNDVGFLVRWRKHLTELKNNKHHNNKLQRLVNKYGILGLKFEIVDFCQSEECILKENFYIQKYDSYDKGLNLTIVSNSFLGRKHKESTKEKIKNANLGKKLSEKTKELISKSHKGKFLTEEHIQKVKSKCKTFKNRYCYNKNGDLIQIFSSGRECEKHFGLKKGKLWSYIKSQSFLEKNFLIFNTELTKKEVLNIIKQKQLKRDIHINRMNIARLSKKIPS